MENNYPCQKTVDFTDDYPTFKPEMKETHTILIPDMLPYHFEVLKHILILEGYKVEVLHNDSRAVIDEGLKHVHNDTCFPALCVIGQYIDALKSGKYDVDHTAVLISQTGGGCRASNYLPLIRKALKAEFPQVPVLSINFSGLEKGNGIPMTIPLLLKLAYGIFYGDNIMTLYNQTLPYELEKGAAAAARAKCVQMVYDAYDNNTYKKYKKITKDMLAIFKQVERSKEEKVKVGVVGEIYVKYSPLGNSHLEDFLHSEDCETVIPGLMDFVLYCIVNNINDGKLYGRNSFVFNLLYKIVYKVLHGMQKNIIKIFKTDGTFEPLHDFEHLRHCADKVINQGVKMGEGWLIPAEMAALAETGTDNIVCAQPFGCLPNHIAGKGVVRTLKNMYVNENIVPVDYDPSATRVNQENRIKLMLATARENLKNKQAQKQS
ncbi:MAG: 2-hydroxyacyl-CoA dehydratase [Clostridia bacterium]|nr:2-hydroxyacyl-CoA dehydratase [Clostridia bacterium]